VGCLIYPPPGPRRPARARRAQCWPPVCRSGLTWLVEDQVAVRSRILSLRWPRAPAALAFPGLSAGRSFRFYAFWEPCSPCLVTWPGLLVRPGVPPGFCCTILLDRTALLRSFLDLARAGPGRLDLLRHRARRQVPAAGRPRLPGRRWPPSFTPPGGSRTVCSTLLAAEVWLGAAARRRARRPGRAYPGPGLAFRCCSPAAANLSAWPGRQLRAPTLPRRAGPAPRGSRAGRAFPGWGRGPAAGWPRPARRSRNAASRPLRDGPGPFRPGRWPRLWAS